MAAYELVEALLGDTVRAVESAPLEMCFELEDSDILGCTNLPVCVVRPDG